LSPLALRKEVTMAGLLVSLVLAAAQAAPGLTPAQAAAVKEHYRTLGSTAIEQKPASGIPGDVSVARIDASPHIRSASFGHSTTLVVALPAPGEWPKQYWVEYGRSTNHAAALYGPFALPPPK
jgi:hypothetical protein